MRTNRAIVWLLAGFLILSPFQGGLWAAGKPAVSAASAQQGSEEVAPDDNELDFLEEGEVTEPVEISDPFEKVNQQTFNFNDGFYFHVAKPLATGYKKVFPEDFRLCLRNFLDVLRSPVRFGACLLQGNPTGALIEFTRTAVNILGGAGGLFDPATAVGLPKQPEDMGQTLAVWGLGPGPYIVWPFVGPSSLRRSVGYVGDALLHPLTYVGFFWWIPFAEVPTRELNELSFHLGEYESFKDAALDPYVSMRDAYVTYRNEQAKLHGIMPQESIDSQW